VYPSAVYKILSNHCLDLFSALVWQNANIVTLAVLAVYINSYDLLLNECKNVRFVAWRRNVQSSYKQSRGSIPFHC